MKLIDPMAVKMRTSHNTLIIAGSQLMGGKARQEDCFLFFHDECVAVADGVSSLPHGDTAAGLAADTAIWGYKHIRQLPFYFGDRRLLLKRIFRTANLTLWQKQKERGFTDGLATTLSVVVLGGYKFWVGTVGDTGVLLYREGLIDVLTTSDTDERGNLTNALGVKRLGIIPHVTVEKFVPQDTILIATDGVLNFLDEEQLRVSFEIAGNTAESLTNACEHLLHAAHENGSDENMTAVLIKRIRNE